MGHILDWVSSNPQSPDGSPEVLESAVIIVNKGAFQWKTRVRSISTSPSGAVTPGADGPDGPDGVA